MTEITNEQAQRDIEAAGQRMRSAIDNLVLAASTGDIADEIDELRAAAADLYDGGIDYAMDVKQSTKTLDDGGRQAILDAAHDHLDVWSKTNSAAPPHVYLIRNLINLVEHPPTKTLDDVWESVEKLNERLPEPTSNYDYLSVEDVVKPPVAPDLTGPEQQASAALNEPDVPATNYGVRITFADGSGYDIDNVDGVQVRDKAHNTFPFGFVEIPNPDGSPSGNWGAGFWSPEDGAFRPFDPTQQPNPNGGW